MTATAVVIIVVVAVLVVAFAGLLARRRAHSHRLQEQFGPEYDRTLEQMGGRRPAEQELHERSQRRRQLQIRPLEPGAQAEFGQRWQHTQKRFVDAPIQAVKEADTLVAQVMSARGYPVGDFEQQARDVSVDHGSVVGRYRAAHEISLLNDQHQASTEQLREAMTHYRALFAELLGADTSHH